MLFYLPTPNPTYVLGGISLTLTLIVIVLHGMCYASFRTLSSGIALIESAVMSLNAVGYVALVALVLLWLMDIKNSTTKHGTAWRNYGYGLILGYLLVATAVTAGGIAWSASQFIGQPKEVLTSQKRSLMISRCALWVMSVFVQGVLGGYVVVTLTKRGRYCQRPGSPTLELGCLSDASNLEDKNTSQASSVIGASRRHSLEPKLSCESSLYSSQLPASSAASRTSHRYSGRTLFQPDWKQPSLDLNPTGLSFPQSALTRSKTEISMSDRDSSTVAGDDRSDIRKLFRSNSELKRSLDSLVLQSSSGPSSPTASSFHMETSRLPAPPKLRLPDESNIHPLFRSDSPSPPPTATPGTIVLGSPAAGQTISVKTLERVRSTHSLRSHTPRSRSPLFESMEQRDEKTRQKAGPPDGSRAEEPRTGMPSYIMAGHVRKSILQYEKKKYELNESPHES